MHLRNIGIVLMALLLVVMMIVLLVNEESSSAGVIVSTPQADKGALNGETISDLPAFLPSINDKLSYEEEQRLIKNYTPSPSVPESEMAEIIFSKTWFRKNDKDPRSDIVQLTFPRTWLDTPRISEDEAIVMLRVPREMLEDDNINSDTGLITVSYPNEMFEGFTNLTEKNRTLQVRREKTERNL